MKTILSNWNIGKVNSIKKAEKGVVNHNWIIKTTKGKFILRKPHQEYKAKDITFELDYLSKIKLPYKIPKPIPTKNKKFFIKTKEGFFWLYKFIEGKQNNKSGKKELAEVAKMAAAYHKILVKSKLKNHKPILKNYGRNDILKWIKEHILEVKKTKTKGDKIFIKELKKLIPILKNLDGKVYNSLKKYPIHRDLNPENFLWKNNKIIAIIDFDNVGYTNDTLTRDLAIIMQYHCSNKKRILNKKKVNYFLKQYQKHRELTTKEINIIPDLIIATYIEDFVYSHWLLVHDPKRGKVERLKLYSNAAQRIYKEK